MNNYGKIFEEKFKQDWLKMEGSDLTRFYDTTNGYKHITNVSDYVCYLYPFQYYIECKSTLGNTFSISKLTQKEKLAEKIGKPGVNAGVMIWFYEKDQVVFVPIEEILRLEKLDYKSINLKDMADNEDFEVFNIPSKKLRVYLECDYSIMTDIARNKLDKMLKGIENDSKKE